MISNKLLVGILFLLIGISVYAIFTIRTESAKCMADPFKYSIDILEKQTLESVVCSCSAGKKTIIITNNGSIDIGSYLPKQNLTLPNYNNILK